MSEFVIQVAPEGELRFVWDDQLSFLRDAGTTSIRRASHVEPTENGRWTADMGPSGGGVLGPFDTRGEALAAERVWLRDHQGL